MNKIVVDLASKKQESLKLGISALNSLVNELDTGNNFLENYKTLKAILLLTQEEIKLLDSIYGMIEVEI